MSTLWHDIRFAARMLLKSRGFTFVAVLSLAIGIGANTAIFSLAKSLLFPALPFADAVRLVDMHEESSDHRGPLSVSYLAYQNYRDENKVFESLLCWGRLPLSLSTGEAAEQAFGIIVSGNYFATLGAKPARGRFFLPEEDATPGTHAVVVISHRFWQRRFGGEADIIGRVVSLNGVQFTVIGIASEKFTSTIPLFAPDVWVPMMMHERVMPASRWLGAQNAEWLEMTGRLKEGVSMEQAQANISQLTRNYAAAHPNFNRREGEPERNRGGVELVPVGSLPREERMALVGFLGLLLAVVSLVLLIACANLTSLLLVRATARRREIAVRLALGASRFRLARQLLTESVLLCLVSGVLGFLFAFWMIDLLLAFKPPIDIPIELNIPVDTRALGWTFMLSLATGIVFGLIPALQSSKPDLTRALKDDARSMGFRRSRLRDLFVTGQIAMTLLLLICAGLFLRALAHASTVHPGTEPERVVTATFDPKFFGYDERQTQEFYRQLLERVRALPGVEGAGLAMMIPVGEAQAGTLVGIEGNESFAADLSDEHSAGVHTEYNIISPGYLQTMKISLLRGRDFGDADRDGAASVAIIDETMRRRYFAGIDPLGKRIKDAKRTYEIVGVAQSGSYRTLNSEPRPFIYLPFAQHAGERSSRMVLHARSADNNAANIYAAIRREVAAIDRNIPLQEPLTIGEYINFSLLPQRIATSVAGVFALTGLVLSALGIFGMVSYSVSQRTHEIGIRMALGAQQGDVLRMVLRQGWRVTSLGLIIGIALAVAVTRLLSSLLYGVSATDLATFVVVSSLLAAVAMLASYIPARRAAKIDPMVALRYE
ncbi:MAG: ABC transporter permease [Pyrinomonadaceae bacterium]|nr:ABC transporter permease [Pyrinomonadaceae bacterium]